MINGIDEFQKASKESVDLATKSFGAVSKGLQAIATEYADFSKKSVEESTAAFEKMIAAKAPDKAFEVQADYMKSAYENMVTEFNKLSEMYLDLGKEIYKPYEGLASKAASK
ncbi:phasin family protein [Breoghania corrubedonensis]|uniref:Phasin family protein n=1 Tax=Breoghania corrubedonensis TaxID=665038 RepID=A0A2T5VCL2_9HYPH|nr:phasin family protein [Breoghania corrubedonensis]PTW61486.1 phasin family protein [Breoghania corrubedonensis]